MRCAPHTLLLLAASAASIAAMGCKSVPPTNAAAIKAEPSMLFWGDTHVRSAYSAKADEPDARGLDPHQAYLWAQGLAVNDPQTGAEAKLDTPLDFLIVTDGASRLQDPAWNNIVETAENSNEPCHFTSFVGWEWGAPSGGDPHVQRVVIMKQGSEQAREVEPATSRVDGNPESLWAWLGATRSRLGIDFIVMPYVTGLVAKRTTPFDEQEARMRQQWEPVASLGLRARFDGQSISSREDFARDVLLRGLQVEQTVGVNPFKFGIVGAESRNGADLAAPALTGVYAEENTRQAIFAAMQRKEVYATTGPRIRVRFFAGWNFEGK